VVALPLLVARVVILQLVVAPETLAVEVSLRPEVLPVHPHLVVAPEILAVEVSLRPEVLPVHPHQVVAPEIQVEAAKPAAPEIPAVRQNLVVAAL